MENHEEKQRGQFIDRFLEKRGVSEDGRAETRLLLNHPLQWLKGEFMPFGRLAPWEKVLFFISGFSDTASGQWDGRERLFRYTYMVNPNHITVSNIVSSVWDAFNDPFVGQWMDRHPWKDNTYRWIRRISHTVSVAMTLLYMLDLGLTPMQRILLFTGGRIAIDLIMTMGEVANAKFYAGITPFSDERGRTQVWQNVGNQAGYAFGNIPQYIMGFARDRSVWTDYRIYTRGFAFAVPLLLCKGIVTTFARNRVQLFKTDAQQAQAAMQAELAESQAFPEPEEPRLTIRESFRVLKHNKFLLYNTIAGVITSFTPSMDEYSVFRFLFPQRKFFKWTIRGEGVMPLVKQIAGFPIMVLYPFLGTVVKKLGGPKRTFIIQHVCGMIANLGRFAFGYKSVAGLAMITIAQAVLEVAGPLDGFAKHILHYEMIDYVEYKTGIRSEGITFAFEQFLTKLLKNNLDGFTANAFQKWTGITDRDWSDNDLSKVPERFKKWAWPMFTLAPVADGFIWLIARASFPYDPGQKDVIEAELKERRALAAQAKEEMGEPA